MLSSKLLKGNVKHILFQQHPLSISHISLLLQVK